MLIFKTSLPKAFCYPKNSISIVALEMQRVQNFSIYQQSTHAERNKIEKEHEKREKHNKALD